MPTSTKRKTIGVFVSQVGRAWGSEFLAGINDAGEENNINVVYFVGGTLKLYIQPKPSFGFYDLARAEQLDGLIVTGDTAFGVSAEDLKIFREMFGELPLVTQSVDLDNASMFIPDNTEGMRSLGGHLNEEHGYK
ncbi:MAG TPA: hypothetical protein PLF41_11680, partial [Anaerolineales bacterium]|nr:hypothetical protein [Anaerolineales bacterium]